MGLSYVPLLIIGWFTEPITGKANRVDRNLIAVSAVVSVDGTEKDL